MSVMSPTHTTRHSLRQQMRSRRHSLTPHQQQHASTALLQQWQQSRGHCRHLALYWPSDGEIDPRPVAEYAWRMGFKVYLPVLHPWRPRQLWFIPFTPDTRLQKNRFGIPEPVGRKCRPIKLQQLDRVLLPLVAFDRRGGRLGMGGGFYDATFAFKRTGKSRPRLIGVAHSFQEVNELPLEPWDVPLDAVITEQEWIDIRRSR